MARAARRWRHAFAWILCLCMLAGCAMATFTWLYEPDVYRAVYTLYAQPTAEAAPLEASRMLARDCAALTRTQAFRQAVLAQTRSDGMCRVSVQGIDGTHLMELSVVGPDAHIVQTLANVAGQTLVEWLPATFDVTEAREITAAEKPDAPFAPNRLCKTALAVLAAFAIGSLLACLFGADRVPFDMEQMAETTPFPMLGTVADVHREAKRFSKQRKKRGGMFLSRVDRLVRENVRAAALKLRMMLGGKGGIAVLAGLRSSDEQATFAALVAGELAAQGYRVLLVEMEGQTTELASLLNVDTRADLSDYLRGRAALRDIVVRPQDSTLCFIDQKHHGQSAAEIVSQTGFSVFCQSARSNFDYVLFNASPVDGCCDAAMLGAYADVTLLCARDGAYTAREIGRVVGELRGVVRRFGGVALTRVKREKFGL